jgi:hypothetical protein
MFFISFLLCDVRDTLSTMAFLSDPHIRPS